MPAGMASKQPASRYAVDKADVLLKQLSVLINRAAKSPDRAAVHDVRVGIRRLTQIFLVFKPYFPPKERKRFRRRLKTIMSRAGDVRDCDIAIKLLKEPGAATRTQRREAARSLAETLQRWLRRKSSSKWRAKLITASRHRRHEPPGEVISAAAGRILRAMAGDFLARGQVAVRASAPRELHRFRIAAKKFHYTLELFAPFYPSRLSEWLEPVKDIQRLLGQINDYATVRRMISKKRGQGAAADELKKKQRDTIKEFRGYWNAQFSGRRNLRAFVIR